MKQDILFRKLHLKFTFGAILFSTIFVIPLIVFFNLFLVYTNISRSSDFVYRMENELQYGKKNSSRLRDSFPSGGLKRLSRRRNKPEAPGEKEFLFGFIPIGVSVSGDRNVMCFRVKNGQTIIERSFSDSDLDSQTLADLRARAFSSRNKITKYGFYMVSSRTTTNGIIGVVLDRSYELYQEYRLVLVSIFIFLLCVILSFIVSWFIAYRAIAPVSEAFENQKRFIADASHELKTPLAVMGANIDVLQSEIPDNKWLEYIRIENLRMTELVKDLLFLAKSDSGQIEPEEFSEVALVNETACAVLPFESLAFEARRQLKINLPEEELYVLGDAAKLKQCAVILTDNAIKNCDVNGIVTVSAGREGNCGFVKVTNTGPGIKKEDLPFVFERFFRSDSSRARSTGGYGLGLSIAQLIVKTHNGRMEVHSTENELTDFTFYIPLAT